MSICVRVCVCVFVCVSRVLALNILLYTHLHTHKHTHTHTHTHTMWQAKIKKVKVDKSSDKIEKVGRLYATTCARARARDGEGRMCQVFRDVALSYVKYGTGCTSCMSDILKYF